MIGGGKDSIDHEQGAHDDVANAACGCLVQHFHEGDASKKSYRRRRIFARAVPCVREPVIQGGQVFPRLYNARSPGADVGSIGLLEGAGVHDPIGNWRNLVPTLKVGFGPTIFLHLKRAVPTSGSQLHR